MIISFYLSRPFQNKSYKVPYWAGGTGGLRDFKVLLVIVGQSLHSLTYWGYSCVSAGSTISSQSTLTRPCAKLWRGRWVRRNSAHCYWKQQKWKNKHIQIKHECANEAEDESEQKALTQREKTWPKSKDEYRNVSHQWLSIISPALLQTSHIIRHISGSAWLSASILTIIGNLFPLCFLARPHGSNF